MMTYFSLSAAVVALMAADVISGAAVALSKGEFRSNEMRAGFWRKLAEIAALFGLLAAEQVVNLVGVELAAPFGFIGGAGYLAAMEAASLVENMKAGVAREEKEEGESFED